MPTSPRSRIALIHATRLSVEPIRLAFERRWPEADCFELLDESLSRDRAASRALDLQPRFIALSQAAQAAGAHGILYTCSAFGPEIDAARAAVRLPTLKPNEAMFDASLRHGPTIGLLATFEPSLAPMTDELRALAASRGLRVEVRTRLVEGAFDALARGDAQDHDERIVAAARRIEGIDVLLLAQFSMARARDAVAAAIAVPVLASPDSAVVALRAALAAG